MKTVAIIGNACPWTEERKPTDQSVECWGINDGWKQMRAGFLYDAWDRWFDVHPEAHIRARRPRHWEWMEMQTSDRPIYLTTIHPTIRASVAYPLADIQHAFGHRGTPEEFFTSSLDYCLALALFEGVDRIEVYGADMYASHERQHRDIYRKNQREGASYWIGRARGMGIDVVMQTGSSLCRTEYLYGYHEPTRPENFVSMSWQRFCDQLAEARRLRQLGA